MSEGEEEELERREEVRKREGEKVEVMGWGKLWAKEIHDGGGIEDRGSMDTRDRSGYCVNRDSDKGSKEREGRREEGKCKSLYSGEGHRIHQSLIVFHSRTRHCRIRFYIIKAPRNDMAGIRG